LENREKWALNVILKRTVFSSANITATKVNTGDIALQYANATKYPEAGPIFQAISSIHIDLPVIVILATALIATWVFLCSSEEWF